MIWSWFQPTCPVEFKHKVWIEYRLRFLALRMGIDRFEVRDVLIPTAEAIPELAPGRSPDIRSLAHRLCDRLKIDQQGLTIDVVDQLPIGGASGVYRTKTREVLLLRSLLTDPAQLLATLIHELLHDLLLHGQILTGDEPDHEQMTDLAACLVGCGIPLANSTLRSESGHTGTLEWWTLSRSGYLSSPEFGYALALCCWIEELPCPPSWNQYLRLDAREPLRNGMKFLYKSGDTLFRRGSSRKVYSPSPRDLLHSLYHGTDTEILGSLWDLSDSGRMIEVHRAGELVEHREPNIRVSACQILEDHPHGEEARSALIASTQADDPETRIAGIRAFARKCPKDIDFGVVVRRALQDRNPKVIETALWALTVTQLWDEHIERQVIDTLVSVMRHDWDLDPHKFLKVLWSRTESLEEKLQRSFAEDHYPKEWAVIRSLLNQIRRASLS